MEPTKCLICESSQLEDVILSANDHITGDVFQIFGCKNCGIYFTYPVPDDMESYYPSKYRRYSYFVMFLLKVFYRFRVKNWLKMRDDLGTALEIGCGSGLMLDALHKKGWEVVGIERTEAMAAKARDTFGLNVVSGSIELLPREARFDLIILFNVLEHVHAPQTILKECASRMKPGGFLILNVPNFDSWQANFSKHLWLHLDPPRHLFHFTPKSLKNILDTAGLEIYDIKFASFEHDPFGWIQSSINKITGSHNVLTRYLMGLERFNFNVTVSLALGLLMVIPAIFLSTVSWIMKKGALMQVTAVLPKECN